MEAPLMFTLKKKNRPECNYKKYFWMGCNESHTVHIWLKCQRYKTFPQLHQQKFIENIIFAEFFRTAYIVQYHHFIP